MFRKIGTFAMGSGAANTGKPSRSIGATSSVQAQERRLLLFALLAVAVTIELFDLLQLLLGHALLSQRWPGWV